MWEGVLCASMTGAQVQGGVTAGVQPKGTHMGYSCTACTRSTCLHAATHVLFLQGALFAVVGV
jgi:hypothetical protein